MAKLEIFDEEFTHQAEQAWDRARDEALANGIPAFIGTKASRSWNSPKGAS